MKTVIRRKVRPNRIFYLTEHANIHCECNTTYGFLLRKILLSNEKGLIFRLQQENWLLGLLASIPPFSFYNLPNYVLYKNNTKIGYTKALRKAYNKTLFCANDEYLFTLHGNNNRNKNARKYWVFRLKCRYSVGINRDVYTFITLFDCRKQPLFR